MLASAPTDPDALYLLGLVAYRQGRVEEAMALVGRAIRVDAKHALAHGSMAQMHQDRGRHDQAVTHFRLAAALRPDNPDFHNGLGLSLAALGRLEPATAAFREAIRIRPGMAAAYNNLGNVQRACGDPEGAADSFRLCLKHRPDFAEAHNNLGVLYQEQQRPEPAMRHFESAIAARTGYAEAHSNLGAVFNDLGDTDRALMQFQNAMDLEPSFSEACVNAGMALHKLGDHERARDTLDLALRMAPGNPTARWARCIAELDSAYPSTEAMARARRRYEKRLRSLVSTPESDPRDAARRPESAAGAMQPFLLPYQGGDDLALQCLYGDHLHAVMHARAAEDSGPTFPKPAGAALRVGVVSGYFHDHSNWKVPIQGWLQYMAGQVELFGYYTGNRHDAATRHAESLCSRFYSGQSGDQLASLIRREGIDVLIYPEVGMHPVTARLAARRLAPVQCASWGHPVTTGLPTMDYFLSSELMEPAGSEAAYRETLVRLPGLSFVCAAPGYHEVGASTRARFGLRDEDVVYLCVQNLSKYLPAFDHLLTAVAGRVAGARLVFIEGPGHTTEIVRARLRRAFDAAGLAFEAHVLFLPRLNRDQYRDLNAAADVFLDTPEWSGCNSTLEALAWDVPVVTLPGRWMRGRHAFAFYQRMEFDTLTARDEAHYIELAVRLGADSGWRAAQRRRIAAAKTRLYDDRSPVDAMVRFLSDAAGGAA